MSEKRDIHDYIDKDGMITCYKFKGIAGGSLRYVCQILDGQLFCSDWRKLNDILEGCYTFRTAKDVEKQQKRGWRLQCAKEAYGVCSLTPKLDDPLMWVFYANEYSGVAIEMRLSAELHVDKDLDAIDCSPLMVVQYSSHIPAIDFEMSCLDCDTSGNQIRKLARHLLTHKTEHWRHEEEIRLLQSHRESVYKLSGREEIVRLWYGPKTSLEDLEKIEKGCRRKIEMRAVSEEYPELFGEAIKFKAIDV